MSDSPRLSANDELINYLIHLRNSMVADMRASHGATIRRSRMFG